MVALVFYCSIFPALGVADQSDPKLDVLFGQLQQAPNPAIASRIELQIWQAWREPPDERSSELLYKAREAYENMDHRKAIAYLDELVAKAPGFAEGWNQRAIASFLTQDYRGSLEDIEKTLGLEPRHFGALSGRGQCYIHLDRPALAIEAFEAALAIHPWLPNIRQQIETLKAYLNSRQPI